LNTVIKQLVLKVVKGWSQLLISSTPPKHSFNG
jgi:hypothetical protein